MHPKHFHAIFYLIDLTMFYIDLCRYDMSMTAPGVDIDIDCHDDFILASLLQKAHRDTEATMHEITLSQRALEIEQQAQQAARGGLPAWLKVGAFSCVEASALTFCFELVCRGTLAEGANCISPNNRLNAGAIAVSSTSILSRSTFAAPALQRPAADRGG